MRGVVGNTLNNPNRPDVDDDTQKPAGADSRVFDALVARRHVFQLDAVVPDVSIPPAGGVRRVDAGAGRPRRPVAVSVDIRDRIVRRGAGAGRSHAAQLGFRHWGGCLLGSDAGLSPVWKPVGLAARFPGVEQRERPALLHLQDIDVHQCRSGNRGRGARLPKKYGNPMMYADECYLNPERDFLLRHARFNKTIVKADGVFVYDEKGNKYLDFLAQYGAVPFGHNPSDIWDALRNQGDVPSMVQPFYSRGARDLAKALVLLEPDFNFSYAVFTNSGAESVEAALKMARAATGRKKVVSLNLGFHGKTSGALTITGNPLYSEPFLINTEDSIKVEPEDFEALDRVFADDEIAAFVLETVMGEGGMRPLSVEYVQRVHDLCKTHKAMMIVDEVQTGMGRLGEFFSIKKFPGVKPDILCLAKALGGGLVPIGAVLCTKAAWSEEFGMFHSSTFANNHVACTAALASIERLRKDDGALMRHVNEVSAYLGEQLDALTQKYADIFCDHQGTGLMHSLRLHPFDGEESYFLAHASVQGYIVPLICGYLVNVCKIIVAPLFNRQDLLRIEPSLTVEKCHIDRLIAALDQCAHLIRHKNFSSLFSYLIDRHPDEVSYSEKHASNFTVVKEESDADATEKKLGSFAFLIHPTSIDDLVNIMPRSIIDLEEPHKSEFQAWMQSWFAKRYDPAPVFHAKKIRSKLGGYVEGWLIACPLPPERMMRLSKPHRQRLLSCYIDCAKSLGVDIVGLGAFTSIISRGGVDVADAGIPITTGNSFTALAGAESLHKALNATGQSDAGTRIAVIGAAGSVGRLSALHLAEHYSQLILVGNSDNPKALDVLKDIAGEIYARAVVQMQGKNMSGLAHYLLHHLADPFSVINACNRILLDGRPDEDRNFSEIKAIVESNLPGPAPVEISVDIQSVLGKAQGVLSATSQGKSFIEPAWLRKNSVVCDAARPPDLKSSVHRSRPDVLVFEGGVVKLNEAYQFGRSNILGFQPGFNLACLSETMMLAMNGADRSYSLGARPSYDQARWIYESALSHGFSDCIATTQGELSVAEAIDGLSNLSNRAL
ncbi:aminotransferase class III-fold pyridoxal phosphate-dependent enzyme [Trinickia terrae]|uniref:Diaminobutyrate--2-oxoglutarate transaminase n=1 Tax=Trinickia terrae TaxID=2571161 RepID=A0A4U1I3G5_9BURK|nr:aminotransferase class III-fold pyridoxal phosphate-dependent enzyme [Trinickia terrae]TKC87783.1 aminotransferase class III-fold pyridoxal phosphate-dependent enzyme [Trinickia terrae]